MGDRTVWHDPPQVLAALRGRDRGRFRLGRSVRDDFRRDDGSGSRCILATGFDRSDEGCHQVETRAGCRAVPNLFDVDGAGQNGCERLRFRCVRVGEGVLDCWLDNRSSERSDPRRAERGSCELGILAQRDRVRGFLGGCVGRELDTRECSQVGPECVVLGIVRFRHVTRESHRTRDPLPGIPRFRIRQCEERIDGAAHDFDDDGSFRVARAGIDVDRCANACGRSRPRGVNDVDCHWEGVSETVGADPCSRGSFCADRFRLRSLPRLGSSLPDLPVGADRYMRAATDARYPLPGTWETLGTRPGLRKGSEHQFSDDFCGPLQVRAEPIRAEGPPVDGSRRHGPVVGSRALPSGYGPRVRSGAEPIPLRFRSGPNYVRNPGTGESGRVRAEYGKPKKRENDFLGTSTRMNESVGACLYARVGMAFPASSFRDSWFRIPASHFPGLVLEPTRMVVGMVIVDNFFPLVNDPGLYKPVFSSIHLPLQERICMVSRSLVFSLFFSLVIHI